MKQTLVCYKIKPEEEQDNVRLIEEVFRELKAKAPEGVRYMCLRINDATFVHFTWPQLSRHVLVVGATGSGKTWVLAAAGRAWAAAGLGRVVGITPSQSARNTLAAGVPVSYNCAQFLAHLPGSRGARGPVQLRAGDLVLMDEASMVATPDQRPWHLIP